jgi:hypothetical protein
MDSQIITLCFSSFYLHTRRIMNPPPLHYQFAHLRTDLHFTYLIQKPAKGAPTLHSFSPTFLPYQGHSFYTGAPVSVFCTSFPKLLIIHCINTFISSHFHFATLVITVGDLPSFFGNTQPMSPLVGASLLIHPRRHRLSLQSITQVTYHLSSKFVHLVLPLAQLSPGLVVPLTLDLVTWLRPLFLSYILQPRAILSHPTS